LALVENCRGDVGLLRYADDFVIGSRRYEAVRLPDA